MYESSFANSLVFKGGTSLSKIFGTINRFSEDIDLSVSTEFLGLAVPGSFRPVPADHRVNALKRDYQAMRDMYISMPPSFDEVMFRLAELESQINVEGGDQ